MPRSGDRDHDGVPARPCGPLPDRAAYLARWSQLHGTAAPAGLVRGWLVGVHALAAPLAALGTPPALVTGVGAVFAVAAAALALAAGPGGLPAVLAGLLLVAGGVLDSVDGAVAVLRERVSRRGALLDAVCDRVGDAGCAAVLAGCGAPVWLALLAGGLAQLQEYARARAQGLGLADVGVVTMAERPVRIAVAAACAGATALVPGVAWATAGAAVWAGLGVGAAVQLGVLLARRLD